MVDYTVTFYPAVISGRHSGESYKRNWIGHCFSIFHVNILTDLKPNLAKQLKLFDIIEEWYKKLYVAKVIFSWYNNLHNYSIMNFYFHLFSEIYFYNIHKMSYCETANVSFIWKSQCVLRSVSRVRCRDFCDVRYIRRRSIFFFYRMQKPRGISVHIWHKIFKKESHIYRVISVMLCIVKARKRCRSFIALWDYSRANKKFTGIQPDLR